MFATTIVTTHKNPVYPMVAESALFNTKAEAEKFVNGMMSALFLVGMDFGGSVGDWMNVHLITPRGDVRITTANVRNPRTK